MRIDKVATNDIYGLKNKNVVGDEVGSIKVGGVELKKVAEKNNDFQVSNTRLQFSIHEATKQIMVKIIDNSTDEVVKEIPPEKLLDMVANMIERAGLLVDRKV